MSKRFGRKIDRRFCRTIELPKSDGEIRIIVDDPWILMETASSLAQQCVLFHIEDISELRAVIRALDDAVSLVESKLKKTH